MQRRHFVYVMFLKRKKEKVPKAKKLKAPFKSHLAFYVPQRSLSILLELIHTIVFCVWAIYLNHGRLIIHRRMKKCRVEIELKWLCFRFVNY